MSKFLTCVVAGIVALTLTGSDALAGKPSRGKHARSGHHKHVSKKKVSKHTRHKHSGPVRHRASWARNYQLARTGNVRIIRRVSQTGFVRQWDGRRAVRVFPRSYFRSGLGYRWMLNRYRPYYVPRFFYGTGLTTSWLPWGGPWMFYCPGNQYGIMPPAYDNMMGGYPIGEDEIDEVW
jgi:hypothetical protein